MLLSVLIQYAAYPFNNPYRAPRRTGSVTPSVATAHQGRNKPRQTLRQRVCYFLFLPLVLLVLVSGCGTDNTKVYKIGILVGVDAYAVVADGFVSEMTKLGYVNGVHVSYDIRNAHSDVEKMEAFSRDFVKNGVDLIIAVTTGAAFIAKKTAAPKNIPVIFCVAVVFDNNLIHTMREPGGNITGVRYPTPDMGIKRMEYLLTLKPSTQKLLIVYQKDYPATMGLLKGLRPAAISKGITLVEVAVNSLEELETAFENMSQSGVAVDALQIMPEPFAHSDEGWALIRDFAEHHRLPIAGIVPSMAKDGAVFSYNPDSRRMGEMAAPLARKVLTGTAVGTIPVVSPELYLRINYSVCEKLGLKVPDKMLKVAAEIIR